jgi:hypothetical protein
MSNKKSIHSQIEPDHGRIAMVQLTNIVLGYRSIKSVIPGLGVTHYNIMILAASRHVQSVINGSEPRQNDQRTCQLAGRTFELR